ncbi:MAG: phosphate ABC transporter permease subunit PstC [Firmicutes bacterium HGW-Firmicutes-2]|jgi:phosphate transport system permease protein|nr:MAG: phosphate ABC transporter permease subunit PstC [Firmicutes bacterium HGW-Firmicutes-2]
MEPSKTRKRALHIENIAKRTVFLFSSISVLTTAIVVYILFSESFIFFKEVSIVEFFTSTKWSPTLRPQNFGVLPLLTGTLMIAIGASLIAIPFGLGSAIYLSEYAPKKVRKILKPILEILAGIPSIVYGFFALTVITPLIRVFLPQTQIFNALSASIAVGIMIIPMVASLSEDAMMAVPDSLRKGAYALGSTQLDVVLKVVLPAAISGIGSAFILAISRAIGETMIVAIAAGQSPTFTLNPLNSIQTMTGFMVNISLGDIQHGTIEYQTLFAIGGLLFFMTLSLNILARWIVKKQKEKLG